MLIRMNYKGKHLLQIECEACPEVGEEFNHMGECYVVSRRTWEIERGYYSNMLVPTLFLKAESK